MNDLTKLPLEEKKKLLALLKEKEERVKYNKLEAFRPYGWQSEFIAASKINRQLLAMTGNRCGKTYTGGHIMACHLTGNYPEHWDGHRFDRPINAWAAGISTVTTRDIVQSELLGDCNDPDAFGSGSIPRDAIVSVVNRPGVPNAVETVLVRHASGGLSKLSFKSYEMSQDKFMGTSLDLIWLDEECPEDIFTQCITRTATTGGITYLTFTPEHGLTPLVKRFTTELKDKQYIIQATWEDAPHLDEATKEQLLSVYSPMEREMRSKGQPSLGTGVIFPVSDEKISVEPFPIPSHWPRILGIDLGFDHPNACVGAVKDPDTGTYYVYDEYSERKETIPMHASAIRRMGGDKIPVILPHDAFKHDAGRSGKQFIKLYEDEGINCLPECFSNPATPDGKVGTLSREYGLHWMLTMMQEGKLKVFSTCKKFFLEKSTYHRKEGKIIDEGDDVISAARYALLSIDRFGRPTNTDYDGYFYQSNEPLIPDWLGGIV